MIETAGGLEQAPASLAVRLAAGEKELEQAFRLRYQVFVEEEKNGKLYSELGLEQDAYDAFCDHLIVKDLTADRVVGTYRLLPGERTAEGIGFYSESEFQLGALWSKRSRILELGRSCVAAEYRGGRTMQLLWEGIAAYLAQRPYDYLIGCASMHVQDMEELNLICALLRKRGMLTERYGVQPLDTHRIHGLSAMDTERTDRELLRLLPPLLKGYHWLGAELAGDPAYDEIFGTVDFLVVLEQERISRKYKNHFLKS